MEEFCKGQVEIWVSFGLIKPTEWHESRATELSDRQESWKLSARLEQE